MRVKSPLQILEPKRVFYNRGVQGIPHTNSLLLSVLAARSLVPVPRKEVRVNSVKTVNSGDVGDPHSEGAVGVDGVFLEIPVHFVGDCFRG